MTEMERMLEEESSTPNAILSSLCQHLVLTGQTAESFFRQLDTDGGGDLDASELHAALFRIGIKVSVEAAAAALAQLDLDGDGEFSISHLGRQAGRNAVSSRL